MYISIDRENMKVLHKHKIANVVCDLVWIEANGVCVQITHIDIDFLKIYTDVELVLLARNLGANSDLSRYLLKKEISEKIELLPETDVSAFEAGLQAAKVKQGEPRRYVKGASTAATFG